MIETKIENAIHEYMEQCGRLESEEIMERVKKSKIFNENIEIVVQQKRICNGTLINRIVASSHWKLAIGHKRKIYFASLLFLFTAHKKMGHLDIQIDEELFLDSFNDIQKSFNKMM